MNIMPCSARTDQMKIGKRKMKSEKAEGISVTIQAFHKKTEPMGGIVKSRTDWRYRREAEEG